MKKLVIFLLMSFTCLPLIGSDITSNLIGWWKFDDGLGIYATDSSGNGNTGVVMGQGTWVTGMGGKALQFNGLDGYVRIPSNESLRTGQITVAMWVKAKDFLKSGSSFWAYGRSGCVDNYRSWYLSSGAIGSSYQNTANNTIASPRPGAVGTVKLGEWAFYTFTYAGDADEVTITAYKNGVAAGTAYTDTDGLDNCGTMTAIGSHEDYPNAAYQRTFSGIIDDVRVYSRVLTEEDITALYNVLKPTYTDTSAPTTPADLVATAVDATHVSLSWTASTDDTAVVGYIIYRCTSGGGACTPTAAMDTVEGATTYTDAARGVGSTFDFTVAAATTYYYKVAAYDAAYNVSSLSTADDATTPAAGGSSYTLTVTKTGASTKTVGSIPAGIDCGSTCSYSFAEGTVVVLKPDQSNVDTGNSPTAFSGWSGAGCIGNGECYITMDSAKSVVARYMTKHYVRAGATGSSTGADWTNAWPTFSAMGTPTRGDIYYVASGAYAENVTLSPTAIGSTWTWFRHATVADHGTSTGWSDAYASGQAEIQGVLQLGTYVDWDGVTGSETSGHGFKIKMTNCTTNSIRGIQTFSSYVRAARTELELCGIQTGYVQDGVYSVIGSALSNQYYEYLYIHDVGRNGFTLQGPTGNIVIDHIYMDNVSGIGDIHGQAIQLGGGGATMSDITVRNSKFKDVNGQSIVSMLGSVAGTMSNIRMHDNVIWQTDWDVYRLECGMWISSTQDVTGVYHYNNTYYHVWGPEPYSLNISDQTETYSRNNIYVACNFDANVQTPPNVNPVWNTSEYNYFYNNTGSFVPSGEVGQVNGTLDPFVSAPDNLALNAKAEAINNGTNLGYTYQLDYTGYQRSSSWDIGAYEYGSGSDTTPPTISITDPTSDPTYATIVGTIDVAGSASDDTGVSYVSWVNDRGGSGLASGSTSWSKTGIILYEGVNVLTLTAHDASENTASDTLTVTYTPTDVTPPTISITTPTSSPTYATSTPVIGICGLASDAVGVTSITWVNDRGGGGTATGTTEWTFYISLQSGVNVVTVTAHDGAENTATDTITVTYTPISTSGASGLRLRR